MPIRCRSLTAASKAGFVKVYSTESPQSPSPRWTLFGALPNPEDFPCFRPKLRTHSPLSETAASFGKKRASPSPVRTLPRSSSGLQPAVNRQTTIWGFARLKPGVSIEQAKAALQPQFDYSLRLAPAPFRKEVHLQVRSLRDRQVHDVRLIAWILLGVVLSVLLIACANVSNLLMARGAGGARELAVRSALGATRTRLIRQALIESIVVSLAGTASSLSL